MKTLKKIYFILRRKNKIKITFDADLSLLVHEYKIGFMNKSKKILEELVNSVELKKIIIEKKIEKNLKGKPKYKSKNFKKKKYFKKNKSRRPR